MGKRGYKGNDHTNPKGYTQKQADEYKANQRRWRADNRGTGAVADWASADVSKLTGAVRSVTGAGCAIQFGYTRDGSAYAIRIVGDGEPFTEYVRSTEEIDLLLEKIIATYTA
jgi:hypothetical protein